MSAAQHLQQPVSAHSTTAQFASQHSHQSQNVVLRVFAAHAPWQHVLLFGWQIYLAAMQAYRLRQSPNSPCTPAHQLSTAMKHVHLICNAAHPCCTCSCLPCADLCSLQVTVSNDGFTQLLTTNVTCSQTGRTQKRQVTTPQASWRTRCTEWPSVVLHVRKEIPPWLYSVYVRETQHAVCTMLMPQEIIIAGASQKPHLRC